MKASRKDLETSSPRARQEPQRPGTQSPTEQLLSRDLAAWVLAKEAIAKAKG